MAATIDAKLSSREVHLFHCAERSHGGSSDQDPALVARLRALVPAWAAAKGIATSIEVVHAAEVASAVCESAARLGVDVICVGSHGRSGLRQVVLGSVASAVVRQARQPVLIVRAPAE